MILQEPSAPKAGLRQSVKREAILSAATKLFMREGYAVSVDMVAAEAGVSKQTVYSHFGSKEALFRATFEETKRYLYDELKGPEAPRQGLIEYGHAMLRHILSRESIAMQRLMIAQTNAFPDLVALYAETSACAYDNVTAFFDKALTAGSVGGATPQRLAEDFMALLQGNKRTRLLFGVQGEVTDEEMRRMAEHAADSLMRLYAPRSPERGLSGLDSR